MSNYNDDDNAVALLAGVNAIGLRNMLLAPGTNPRELNGIAPTKMTDWRQFASGNRQPQPQYQQPSPAFGYGIPDPSQVTSQPLLPVPVGVDAEGNVIQGNTVQALQQAIAPANAPVYQQPALQTGGFQLPQFGIPQPPKQNSAVDEDKFDELVKEIKSMKKAINKLIRISEQTKLTTTSNTEQTIENKD